VLSVVFEFNFSEKNVTWVSIKDFLSFTDNLASLLFVVALETWLVLKVFRSVLETVSYLFIQVGENVFNGIVYLLSDNIGVKVSNDWGVMEILV